MPDYAQLPLTVGQQEAAILAFLKTLPRRPKATGGADEGRSTAGVAADIATDFLPIIGELKDLYRAVYGEDPVTGEKIKWWEQVLAFFAALPILGKLFKLAGKGIKYLQEGIRFVGKARKWLSGKRAEFAAWLSEKFAGWLKSRRAKKLEKAQAKARQLAAAEEEIARLAEARRLARTIAPTLEQVQKLVPPGKTWQSWGREIFGTGPIEALDRIGTQTTRQLLEIGVNRDVATALFNWYRGLGSAVGAETRVNRMKLLEHIIGMF